MIKCIFCEYKNECKPKLTKEEKNYMKNDIKVVGFKFNSIEEELARNVKLVMKCRIESAEQKQEIQRQQQINIDHTKTIDELEQELQKIREMLEHERIVIETQQMHLDKANNTIHYQEQELKKAKQKANKLAETQSLYPTDIAHYYYQNQLIKEKHQLINENQTIKKQARDTQEKLDQKELEIATLKQDIQNLMNTL